MENISWMIPIFPRRSWRRNLERHPLLDRFVWPPSGTSFANFWVETEKNIYYIFIYICMPKNHRCFLNFLYVFVLLNDFLAFYEQYYYIFYIPEFDYSSFSKVPTWSMKVSCFCPGCTELGTTLHTREELEDWLRFDVVSRWDVQVCCKKNMQLSTRTFSWGIPETHTMSSCTIVKASGNHSTKVSTFLQGMHFLLIPTKVITSLMRLRPFSLRWKQWLGSGACGTSQTFKRLWLGLEAEIYIQMIVNVYDL